MIDRLLRIKTVIDVTGKSRSSIYADIAQGIFPKPIAIGMRSVAWPNSVIEAWVQDKITKGQCNA